MVRDPGCFLARVTIAVWTVEDIHHGYTDDKRFLPRFRQERTRDRSRVDPEPFKITISLQDGALPGGQT